MHPNVGNNYEYLEKIMPLYEFDCTECNNSFEDLIRSNDEILNVICPLCGSESTKKKISTFATKGSLSSNNSFSGMGVQAGSCSSGST